MKRCAILFVVLLLLSALLVNCRGRGESPIPGVGKKGGGNLEFDNADELLLTDNEVKSFIKAFPDFKKTMEEEGEKLKGHDPKNIYSSYKTGKKALKSLEKINKVLKPYGFTFDSYMQTYAKIAGTFGYTMALEAKKLAKGEIENMKSLLDNPNIPEDQKEEIRESLKELEKMDDSEEAKAYKKNMKIIKKYEDDLKDLFESF
jgi:hypothetical protein